MNNGPDAFEQRIKDSLEQFEVPYNSSDWAQLAKAMDGPRNVGWWTRPGVIAALLAGSVVVGTAALFLMKGTPSTPVEVSANTPMAHTEAPVPAGADQQGSTTASAAQDSAIDGAEPSSNTSSIPAVQREGSTVTGADAGSSQAGTVRTSLGKASGTSMVSPNAAMNATSTTVTAANSATPNNASTSGTVAVPTPSGSAEMTFKASVSKACPGEEVDFKVENMPKDGIYLWNFGDGSFSNKPNPEHTFTKPGNYQVMLSMSAAGVGTIHNKPISDIITIHEAPKAAFNVQKQDHEGHIPSVHFENRSNGADQYHWDFGDGSTSTVAHPDHIYKVKGVYPVKLTVTSEQGCVDFHEKEVRIDNDYNLDAPSAFAPAQAETFMPEALRTLGVKFHLMVYTGDGQLVYETTDPTRPWTGRMNNRGDVLAPGDYVWVVDVREHLHLAETYTGKVTIKK